MKYEIETWPLERLVDHIRNDEIDLQPPYQRNPIWTAKAQRILIDTILRGQPIPNFFVLKREDGKLEMVDGQQRARTIYAYWSNSLIDLSGLTWEDRLRASGYSADTKKLFLEYSLTITLISDLKKDESIEHFYALVNSSGLRLNRPELRKAAYYNTAFLALLLELADQPDLVALQLFGSSYIARMQDFELISEIVASLRFGIIDKKDKVDQLYEDDISEEDATNLKSSFLEVLRILTLFDAIQPIRRTRYKQKGDFYSLFLFLHSLPRMIDNDLLYLYQVLVKLGPHIKPSNVDCVPLRDYAYFCTTQSNSKKSRQERHAILSDILANPLDRPNERQLLLIDYFRMAPESLVKVGPFLTLDFKSITDPNQMEWSFDEFFDDEI